MVKQKFIQFFDVNTTPDSFSVFTVKAGGDIVHQRLAPFFQAYKYYKLGRVNVKCVPASTLPVDPTGLSYEAGENTVDPRDQFNPGLIRITNGEDVAEFSTFDQNRYYATMLDPRWYKFRLQGGFSRSAVPLVWNVAQTGQNMFPDARMRDLTRLTMMQPYVPPSSSNDVAKVPVRSNFLSDNDKYAFLATAGSRTKVEASINTYGITQTVQLAGNSASSSPSDIPETAMYVEIPSSSGSGDMIGESVPTTWDVPDTIQSQKVRLGWMPTDAGGINESYTYTDPVLGTVIAGRSGYAAIPEVDLMTFIFPKAFKTKYYYRIFVETTVYFKDAVVIDPFGSAVSPTLPLDRFGVPARLTNAYTYARGTPNDVPSTEWEKDETI